jgi:anaerobic selenocysteine-containing dehydrogenase
LSTEVLANCISTMCGGWVKAGRKVCHAGLLQKPYVPRAEANNPFEFWAGTPVQPRIRGLRSLTGEMPTPALAEEIMTPGEGQVRALIVNGGNPVAAIPDQRAAVRALKSLDLLVVLDVMMSSTAKIADYVFGCKLSMEKPDFTRNHEFFSAAPFAQYAPALIKPKFDVIEEWEFFWGMAHRMRVPLFLGQPTSSFTSATDTTGVPIDIDKRPTTDELMEIEATGSRIPLQELKQYPRGKVCEEAQVVVEPRDPATAGRFDMAPPLFLEDLQRVLDKPITADGAYDLDKPFSHRLVSRRMLQVYNSTGVHLEELNTEGPGNPAYLNPRDMEVAGIGAGDLIEIESEHGKIVCVAKPEKGLRSGVISMAHAWGDLPPEDGETVDVRRGASTNLLISTNEHYDPLVGMCRQSAIPVNIRRAEMRA